MDRLHRTALLAVSGGIFLSGLYVYFFWEGMPYTNFGSEAPRCYSPNGDYYIIRYLTPFRAQFDLTVQSIGTADLYSKSGRLLYSGTTTFDPQAGPAWGVWRPTFGAPEYSVGFTGNEGAGWMHMLPSSPGEGYENNYCRPN